MYWKFLKIEHSVFCHVCVAVLFQLLIITHKNQFLFVFYKIIQCLVFVSIFVANCIDYDMRIKVCKFKVFLDLYLSLCVRCPLLDPAIHRLIYTYHYAAFIRLGSGRAESVPITTCSACVSYLFIRLGSIPRAESIPNTMCPLVIWLFVC